MYFMLEKLFHPCRSTLNKVQSTKYLNRLKKFHKNEMLGERKMPAKIEVECCKSSLH